MENLKQAISEIVALSFDSFQTNDVDTAFRVQPLEEVVDRICRRMKEKHAQRLQKGKCTIENGYVFNDLVSEFERVSDHCSNIAIVIVELTDNALDLHEMSDLLQQQHQHNFSEYFDEYALRYLKKSDRALEE